VTLYSPDSIRNILAPLLRDVGGMHTVSVVGYDDGDPEKVAGNLARAEDAVGGTWVDLRASDGEEAGDGLLESADATTLILVVRADNLPMQLSLFLRQALDGRQAVDLGDGRVVTRPEDQSVVVLAEGVPDYASAPAELQRIVIWQLVAE